MDLKEGFCLHAMKQFVPIKNMMNSEQLGYNQTILSTFVAAPWFPQTAAQAECSPAKNKKAGM